MNGYTKFCCVTRIANPKRSTQVLSHEESVSGILLSSCSGVYLSDAAIGLHKKESGIRIVRGPSSHPKHDF